MNCKNCENIFEGKFCNNCGQKSSVKRIDFQFLLNEIPNTIFQVNRGFFFTVKELALRPGRSISAFLEGKRIHHYKPLAFLLVTTTLYVLVTFLFGKISFTNDIISGVKEGFVESSRAVENLNALEWIANHEAYFLMMIIPIYSLSTYLVFIKSRYNYFEHLVINFFISGQQMLLYAVLVPFHDEFGFVELISFLVGIAYNLWVFKQMFKEKKWYVYILLICFSYLVFIFFVSNIMLLGYFLGWLK